MAKGKYANAAERRRVMMELEERATTAERASEKAEADLAAYSEKANAEIERLKDRLAQAERDRDAQSSPQLAVMEARNEELRRRLTDAEAFWDGEQKCWQLLLSGFRRYLVRVDGLTSTEAFEVMLNSVPGKERATYITAAVRTHDASKADNTKAELAIGATRGYRHRGDVLAEIFAALKDEPE